MNTQERPTDQDLLRTMERYIKDAFLEFARRHKLRPPTWCDASKGDIQRNRSPRQSKPLASTAMINNAIRSEYNDATAARAKPPNIRELGAPVQRRLDREGFYASKRRIQLLGEAAEFKLRRRPPGRTLKSERPK
jgi:hypothetical protein